MQKTAEGFPAVTAGIFLLCVALLCWTELSGQRNEIIYAFGLSRQGVLAGEYYRFLTSMFLHSGILHLVSNGVYLYYFGTRAEQLLGRARFLLLYLAAGLCGGICSVIFNGWLAIGASGAIYGLLGAMLLLTKKRGMRCTGMSYSTMLILAVSAIGLGMLDANVDNFAHIGGLLGGCAAHTYAFFRQADRYPPVYTRFPQKSVDNCGFMHRICAKNNEDCRNPRNSGLGACYTIQICPAGAVI